MTPVGAGREMRPTTPSPSHQGGDEALARRLAQQATRRSRRRCPGGIIVCLSLARSVATTVRDNDGGGADDGVLAALLAFSCSLDF